MDTKELVAQARARFNHQQSKIALQAKYTSELNLIYSGGLWHLTPELLALLSTLPDEKIILIDAYMKPVQVDVSEMREVAFEKYHEVTTDWLNEYTEMSKKR